LSEKFAIFGCRENHMAEHHELAVFPGGMESKTEITLLTTMAKEGHKRRLASERKKEAERQLEAAKLRKAEQDAKTRLRHEEAARYTQQQRLWWDDEVIHQIAVSKNNYFLEEVRAPAPLARRVAASADAPRQD
jgi:hypothetical protein